jgi:hypothetical protein
MENNTQQQIQHIGTIEGNVQQTQISSGNYYDNSKHYTLNIENMQLGWFQPCNPDAVFYKRMPNVNDRPILENYYKLSRYEPNDFGEYDTDISVPIIFYGYVAAKRSSTSYTIVNLLDEFGEKLAAHVIIKDFDLSEYLNKIIKFTGVIYPYNDGENSTGDTKYSVHILKDKEITVIEGRQPEMKKSPWEMLLDDEPNIHIDPVKAIGDFNKLDIYEQMNLLGYAEDRLNAISVSMFGMSNLIQPIIYTNFLMRDDIYDKKVIMNNILSLNILTTIIVDYILGIKPNNFNELIKIVNYVIMVYMGIDLDKCYDKEKFYELVEHMGIDKQNAKHYYVNAKNNAGGITKMKEVIPESYRTIPGPQGLHGLAAVQFAKRMALDMDLIK